MHDFATRLMSAFQRARGVLLLAICMLVVGCTDDPDTIPSPDGQIELAFALNQDGAPTYTVTHGGQTVIEQSSLGLVLESGPLTENLQVDEITRDSGDETYELVVGTSRRVRAQYNEATVHLSEKGSTGRAYQIVFRVYNEGAAFRYVIPEQSGLSKFTIASEQSTFTLPESATAWALELGSYTTNYEERYSEMTVGDIGSDATIGLPMTVEYTDGPVVGLTEADLTDYAGMYLSGASGSTSGQLVSKLSPLPDDSTIAVRGTAPHESPWRLVMIGQEPGDLIESNLVLHLNDPLALDDPSWVSAGKTAWDWWSGRVIEGPDLEVLPMEKEELYASGDRQRALSGSRMTNEVMKHYIDFAGDYGFEYMLVDAGWYGDHRGPDADLTTTIDAIDIPELVGYAEAQDVKLLLWLNWEPLTQQMDEAFALYQKWGIHGVKIDYMDRDDQEMVDFYHRAIQTAAKHELAVNFHGAYKPTGVRRTYPNLLTREGVLGLEYLKWSDQATPEHNVTIPFTRMLAGPMDYTPGGFDNVKHEQFESRYFNPMTVGTRSHQLAAYVVFESPMQMVSDHPSAYRGVEASAFLRHVPATWIETRVLEGEIGEYIVMARRSGDAWFIGAMTDGSGREVSVDLDFLQEDREYRVVSYGDGEKGVPKEVKIRESTRVAGEQLNIRMASSGGYAARLTPAE